MRNGIYLRLNEEILDDVINTLIFYYVESSLRHSTLNPDTYRLVLDHIWTDAFKDKIVNTYKKLSDMFFVKDGDDINIRPEIINSYNGKDWKLVLYPETSRGVMGKNIPSKLSSREIPFNPTNKESIRRALANLVFYSIFVRGCMASIKTTSQTYFLFYDPFGLHSQEYVRSVALTSDSLRPKSFFWKDGMDFFTDVEYGKFAESFRTIGGSYNDEYITPADLRNFLEFKPPRGNNMDIKLYLIEKFTNLLEGSFEKGIFPKDIDLIHNLFK